MPIPPRDADASDAAVLARSLADPDAFAVIFERHFDAVHRYLRRRFPEQAEEIAGDVFLAAFDVRARYRPEGETALPWLYGIASNLLYKRRRSERRALRAYARAGGRREPEANAEELFERLDAQSQSRVLAGALARLGAADRDVLLLHALAGLTYEEIAVAAGVPVGTVRSRLARARRRCRPELLALAPREAAAGG